MGALLLVCATGCDPEPERTYLALGAAPETRKFTLGTYRSSNPAVLAITDLHDTSGSGCSGVAVLGCPAAVGAGDTTVTISAADVTRELSIGVE